MYKTTTKKRQEVTNDSYQKYIKLYYEIFVDDNDATVMLPLNTIQMCAYFYIVNYKYLCERKTIQFMANFKLIQQLKYKNVTKINKKKQKKNETYFSLIFEMMSQD